MSALSTNGDRLTHGTVELPATSERIQPDLFICPADQSTDGEWFIPAKNVLLAAEVVSLRSEALAFGDKLDLPEPFGITLDATTIPRSQESRGGAGPLPT